MEALNVSLNKLIKIPPAIHKSYLVSHTSSLYFDEAISNQIKDKMFKD